ncbi:hypothetical protein ACQCN2_21160 [Brevibacillus ginsengisoli]|uniref:hypothetical protein n=1 Tax=Brevibacillus ginsengisoli TaxID=363854 RepID=UPI003CF3632B
MPSTVIERYKRILQGVQKRFSPYEFDDVQYRKKKVQMVIRYAVENVCKWTPEEAREMLDVQQVKKLKLHLVKEFVEQPIEAKSDDMYYLVDYAYPYLPKPSEYEKVIWVYQEVLSGKRKHFPLLYFQSIKGEERAKICFEYMCKELLQIKDIYLIPRIFAKTEQAYRILRTYKLKILLDSLYFSPFDLITDIYPELAQPSLWEEASAIYSC